MNYLKSNSPLQILETDASSKKVSLFLPWKKKTPKKHVSTYMFICMEIKSFFSGLTFSMHVIDIKKNKISIHFWGDHVLHTKIHTIIYIYANDAATIVAHVSTCTTLSMLTWACTHQAPKKYIYITKKKKKTYKFEEVKISRGEFKSGFSSWVEEHSKI